MMRAILLYAVVVVAVFSLGESRRHRTGHRRQHIKRQRVRRFLIFPEEEILVGGCKIYWNINKAVRFFKRW